MPTLYECVHRGERHFGLDSPGATTLHLYPLGDLDLQSTLLAADGDLPALTEALTRGREATPVPASDVRLRPPLLPDSVGDALVGGFMATHHAKVDAAENTMPNWFFKGLGDVLKVPGETLRVPSGAVALTEEAEVVLVYLTDPSGTPRYVGHTFGNDLTDIGRFKRNNGHLSYAKLCDAGISPWLFLDAPPRHATGHVTIERDGGPVWQGAFTTGTKAILYDVPEMISGLFAYEALLAPGRVHYVYLGADRSSFHSGFSMEGGDRIEMRFGTHDVLLTNTVAAH